MEDIISILVQVDNVCLDTERRLVDLHLLYCSPCSHPRYRHGISHSTQAIYYAVHSSGKIAYLNAAVERLLGLPPEQIIGCDFITFIHLEDQGRIQANFKKLLSEEEIGPTEYRVVDAAGEVRWVRITSQPVRLGGQIVGTHGVISEITEHIKMERLLRWVSAASQLTPA